MWPSFSLCACRILKIKSCLRIPLAPGSSKVLAILVSSVMFFSFNSAMVMIHLNPSTRTYSLVASGDFQRRGQERRKYHGAGRRDWLSSPPLCLSKILWFRQNFLTLRACDPVQNAIHGFLDSGTGPVEFPRGLGGKLAKHITVPQSLQSIKHTIRAHV